jgi:phosphoserine aminotransferase
VPASSTDRVRLTFNPGPSQVPSEVIADVEEIAGSGLLSESHRGERVKAEVRGAVGAMRSAMAIPDDHAIVFQPSATACMELVLRNLVERRSFHFVDGAFGERFAKTADDVGLDPVRIGSAWERAPSWRDVDAADAAELIAVTHNETSTGMAWPRSELAALRVSHPGPLLAVDVTSSFGALTMDWSHADVWFGSVQKCLGLPAGLGFVIAGPRALERARGFGSSRGVAAWQDLTVLAAKMESGQTVETPNVLALALLGRRMARWDLAEVEAATLRKGEVIAAAALPWRPYIEDAPWRSRTVHCMVVDDPPAWHRRALDAGFRLGKGYGVLLDRCIRIATFPAHGEDDVAAVLAALAG